MIQPRRLTPALALAFFVAGCGGGPNLTVASPEPPPSQTPLECPLPQQRPTYLPWGAPSQTQEHRSDGERGLRYSGFDGQEPVYAYVGVRIQRGIPSIATEREAGSRRVWTYWVGDPGVGEIAAVWQEGARPCDEYVVALRWVRGGAQGIEDELIRTIASLRSSP